jgi:hypothetical protein
VPLGSYLRPERCQIRPWLLTPPHGCLSPLAPSPTPLVRLTRQLDWLSSLGHSPTALPALMRLLVQSRCPGSLVIAQPWLTLRPARDPTGVRLPIPLRLPMPLPGRHKRLYGRHHAGTGIQSSRSGERTGQRCRGSCRAELYPSCLRLRHRCGFGRPNHGKQPCYS